MKIIFLLLLCTIYLVNRSEAHGHTVFDKLYGTAFAEAREVRVRINRLTIDAELKKVLNKVDAFFKLHHEEARRNVNKGGRNEFFKNQVAGIATVGQLIQILKIIEKLSKEQNIDSGAIHALNTLVDTKPNLASGSPSEITENEQVIKEYYDPAVNDADYK